MSNYLKSICSSIFIIFVSLFLVQCGGGMPWSHSNSSANPPADLLKEKEVIASNNTGDLRIAEDGRVLTKQDFIEYPNDMHSVSMRSTQQEYVTRESIPTPSAENFKSYIQEGEVTQGTVVPYTDTKKQGKIKVAILLPLSGQHEKIGQSLLNAAQMALFDVAGHYFELIPRDTKGTIEGAQQAASTAIQNGASFILGPLFADNARAIKPIARSANVKMITFSTDWKLANSDTYVMGFMPFDQVRRVMLFAASQGHIKQALLAPYSPYGNAVSETFKQVSKYYPQVQTTMIERYRLGDENFNDLIRKFTSYDDRVNNLHEAITDLEMIPEAQRTDFDINELARLKIQHTEGDIPFDSILLPIGGTEIRELTSILKYYDVDLNKARFLGTGLWDTPSVYNEVSMQGAWFAAPAPDKRVKFEREYRDIYGETPPRLASLGYDATALLAVLSRQSFTRGPESLFSTESLTNPNGFAGIDGIFRFSRNGLVERGLAVLEVTQKGPKVVSPAPATFQSGTF